MRPESEAALAEAIRDADGPLRITGGGTRGFDGPGTVLETGGLGGIRHYEPGALTLVAGAGTPLDEVDRVLAAEGQRLAFEPMDHRPLLGRTGTPTLGGVIAANVSGPRRIQVGAARDFLLGVRFVDGSGTVIKNGGRVMKNVTGYDLVKLMAGSHGTLGVLTEVALKVLPIPAATGVLLFDGLSDARAVKALSLALGSPFEVTGAAHLQTGMDGTPVTMIRVEGSEASVAYRLDELTRRLAGFGTPRVETDPARTRAGWAHIRDVVPFAGAPGAVWRLSVKPSDAPDLVADLPGVEAVYDWGGGLIWLCVPEDGPDTAAIRAAVAARGGHATRIRGGSGPVFSPAPAAIAALEAGLRRRFDPRGILNPGLMGKTEARP